MEAQLFGVPVIATAVGGQPDLIVDGETGWAQVNGRNAIPWEQRFAYDVWYVEHQSFMLDVKILGSTFGKATRR